MLKAEWATPRYATHRGERIPFLLACTFEEPGCAEISYPMTMPSDLSEFWGIARSASLFKDVKYGQWRTQILSSDAAVEETQRQKAMRPRDIGDHELVVGRFFGDSDLVVVICDLLRITYYSDIPWLNLLWFVHGKCTWC